jgi:hypothetical protein
LVESIAALNLLKPLNLGICIENQIKHTCFGHAGSNRSVSCFNELSCPAVEAEALKTIFKVSLTV